MASVSGDSGGLSSFLVIAFIISGAIIFVFLAVILAYILIRKHRHRIMQEDGVQNMRQNRYRGRARRAFLEIAMRRRFELIIDHHTILKDYSTRVSPFVTPECSICLTEYEKREQVRLVTQCLHVFHPKCLEQWI